jgi:hypothetical protein
MKSRHSGFLEFLADVAEHYSHFGVVARRQQQPDTNPLSIPDDLPIIEVVADKNSGEICIIQSDSPSGKDAALNLEVFHQSLRKQLEQCADYSLVVSQWFQIDKKRNARLDMPLDTVEIDEEAEVLRLLF